MPFLRASALALVLLTFAAGSSLAATVGPDGSPDGPLNRYYSDPGGVYMVSAHRVLEPFAFQRTLGFALDAPGAGRRAFYQCATGTDTFLSLDAGCEGRGKLGLEGYLLTGEQPDSLPVYRCGAFNNHGHLASNDGAGCEGLGAVEGLLGYAPQRQRALNRYNTLGGEHWETARAVTPEYGFEGTLGYVLDGPGADRKALSSCVAGSDHFLSTTQSCASEGFVFASAHGAATRAIYACATGGDRFTSQRADCEGRQVLGQLGHVLTHPVDDDLDGSGPPADCDDGNASIHPGADDVPDNGVDENCNGADAVNFDRDHDGITRPADCDDARADVHPGAIDVPHDGVDQDCNGRDAPYPRMTTTIAGFFTTSGSVTRFTSLRLRGAVKGETVRITCRGRGCPDGKAKRVKIKRSKASVSILGGLSRARLRRGATLEVRVTMAKTIGRVARWEIRAPKSPKRVDRCLSPGAKKPAVCSG